MEKNKFYININPAALTEAQDWYLGCIRDLVAELRRFEEVELVGQECLDMLKDKQTKERILAAIELKESALKAAGDKIRNDDSYTYEEYKKNIDEIHKAYDNWIKAIEVSRSVEYNAEDE